MYTYVASELMHTIVPIMSSKKSSILRAFPASVLATTFLKHSFTNDNT